MLICPTECCAQIITSPASQAVVNGTDVELSCSVSGILSPTFQWIDVTDSDNEMAIFIGPDIKSEVPKYTNFDLDESGTSTKLIILDADISDEGLYRCKELTNNLISDDADIRVEGMYT